MDTATLLIVEGALIGGLVALRVLCIQIVDLESLPRAIVRRIELGNHLAPWVAVLALVAIVIGLALRVV